MDVGTLTGGISELWAFIWPPVVNLAILVALVQKLAPTCAARLLRQSVSRAGRAVQVFRENQVVQQAGISNLLPALAIFTLLFALYAADKLSYQVGWYLPGHVTWLADAFTADLVSQGLMDEILAAFPNVNSAGDLALVVDELAKGSQSADPSGGGHWVHWDGEVAREYWDEQALRYESVIAHVKFYLVFAVALVFVERLWCSRQSRVFGPLFIVIVIGVATLGLSGFSLISALETSTRNMIVGVRTKFLMDPTPRAAVPNLDERIKAITKDRGSAARWSISF